jgi:hypothetical protein
VSSHPCGEFHLVTPELLEREAARLLPCPFCGRQPVFKRSGSGSIGVECRGLGAPPCRVKPKLRRGGRVVLGSAPGESCYRDLKPHVWQMTLDELVTTWNTRAPAASGEVSR